MKRSAPYIDDYDEDFEEISRPRKNVKSVSKADNPLHITHNTIMNPFLIPCIKDLSHLPKLSPLDGKPLVEMEFYYNETSIPRGSGHLNSKPPTLAMILQFIKRQNGERTFKSGLSDEWTRKVNKYKTIVDRTIIGIEENFELTINGGVNMSLSVFDNAFTNFEAKVAYMKFLSIMKYIQTMTRLEEYILAELEKDREERIRKIQTEDVGKGEEVRESDSKSL